MSGEHQANLRRLAKLLKGSPVAADDPLRRLAETLVPDEAYSHDQAEQELPDYVSDELLGRPAARLYPALHRHLLQCETCADLHAGMLAAFDDVSLDIVIPKPRLDFLPPIDWRAALIETVDLIRARVWPGVREPLDAIAAIFFAQIEQGRDVRRLQGGVRVPAFAFGGGDTPVTLRVLAASYMANQMLIARYGSLEQASTSLPADAPAISAIAMDAAREAGIARKERQPFAEAYLALLPGREMGTSPT